VWPANQPTVTRVALHHKKVGDPCWEVMRKERSWICMDTKMDCYTIWGPENCLEPSWERYLCSLRESICGIHDLLRTRTFSPFMLLA